MERQEALGSSLKMLCVGKATLRFSSTWTALTFQTQGAQEGCERAGTPARSPETTNQNKHF